MTKLETNKQTNAHQGRKLFFQCVPLFPSGSKNLNKKHQEGTTSNYIYNNNKHTRCCAACCSHSGSFQPGPPFGISDFEDGAVFFLGGGRTCSKSVSGQESGFGSIIATEPYKSQRQNSFSITLSSDEIRSKGLPPLSAETVDWIVGCVFFSNCECGSFWVALPLQQKWQTRLTKLKGILVHKWQFRAIVAFGMGTTF